jgi:hypothetical protein
MLAILDAFRRDRIDVAAGTIHQYSVAVSQWARFRGHATIDATAADDAREFLRWLSVRRSARTVNNKRAALLRLWRWGFDERLIDIEPPRIRKLKEAKRKPTAWRVEEVARLLLACDAAPLVRDWTPLHWRALVLTIYDTSTRIGALLDCPRASLRGDVLTIPGELQKQCRDTAHRLHPQTLGPLLMLPARELLFAWPVDRREIWPAFGAILRAAGLPDGRRDKFHRIRRTSYSYVVKALGIAAATEHAGHATDLSAIYLDRSILDLPDAVDVLPRPA